MASDANSSWHPALMPNNTPDAPPAPAPVVASDPATAAATATPEPSTSELVHSPEVEDSTRPDAQMNLAEAADGNGDAWFADEPSEDWLAPDQNAPTAESAAPVADEPTPAAATNEAQKDEPAVESNPEPAAGPVLGHSSSVSFARTVSHDLNFNDDEESDWNLSRTDTGPFKFMPPNDRTNSFPAVPPAATAADQQAHDANDPEAVAYNDGTWGAEHPDYPGHEDSNGPEFVGRDALEDGEPDIGTRFVEGVPLIPQNSTAEDREPQPATQRDNFFGEEGAGEEDFFSQIKEDHQDAPDFAPLERKSTMQVLSDSLGAASLSRADTLEDMPEEPEDATDHALANGQSNPNAAEYSPETAQDSATATEPEVSNAAPGGDDLDSKWQQAFAGDDDEDFLLEDTAGDSKELDPAAFFGSDDEGFLEDDEDTTPAQQPAASVLPAQTQAQSTQSRYTPHTSGPAAPQQTAANPYAPSTQAIPSNPYAPSPTAAQFPTTTPYAVQPPPAPAAYGAPPVRTEVSKALSFADKAKGGYSSPYDLPMDVVKPRKRASMQHLPKTVTETTPHAPLPPRSSSMYSQPSPTGPPASGPTPPAGPPVGHHPPAASKPALKSQESFFEDLPMSSKPRSASRQSNRMSSPAFGAPQGLPQGPPQGPPQLSPQLSVVQPHLPDAPPQVDSSSASRRSSGEIPALVAPPRVNPYATLQPQPAPSPSVPGNARYSPAPPSGSAVNGVSRPTSANRYSPAPPGSRPASATYGSAPAQAVLPHLPRTSSPLAHFEVSHDRPSSAPGPNGEVSPHRVSSYEPRLNRVPSLPPTREVEEEEDNRPAEASGVPAAHAPPTDARYAPSSPPAARHTPPPSAVHPNLPSPNKRAVSSYVPQTPTDQGSSLPPTSAHRPSSSQGPTSPQAYHSHTAHAPASRPTHRPRGPSQSFNMVAPTDGRENDPLQRWKGTPIISWGIGGTLMTSFPKEIPRYGMGSATPMIVRTPGEVHIRNIKDIQPLEERLAKFPGPLKGKAKKKETIAWLTAGIETMESSLPDPRLSATLTHDDKRASERVLLWKILRAFIEFDGALEGKPAAEKAVREILTPELGAGQGASSLYNGSIASFQASAPTQMQSDGVDAGAVEEMRKSLLLGDREKAVWAAVDKRLWGHAMLISHTVSPELYQRVAQEFVRKEVNYTGHNNESIAALYKVLSGNHEDCVDELVPSHARAGMQLVNTMSATESVQDAMNGLDKWRETLGLVLSNRSPDDVRALNALGTLLSTYGRAEAAHICFIFSRKITAFGGVDDPNASFVLLGADHKTQAEQFGKETEALLLSEVFEYGLSLTTGHLSTGIPHLAGYKLQHAITLAEYGFRDKALQYTEAIAVSMTAQTKRSPYHHPLLEAAVDDLNRRLKQAPKGESSSWISKPSLNNVSDSMWNRFNKFVAGEEGEENGAAKPVEPGTESGPFARIAGGTPTISPSPSTTNFDNYQNNATGYPVSPAPPMAPATRASSRYAPMSSPAPGGSGPYDPASSYAPAPRSSNEYGRSSSEALHPPMDSQAGFGGYAPQSYAPPSYTPNQPQSPPQLQPSALPIPEPTTEEPPAPSPFVPYGAPAAPFVSDVQPHETHAPNAAPASSYQPPTDGYQPPSYGFEPPSLVASDVPEPHQTENTETSGGYAAPSFQPYGYEPPTYNPGPQTTQDDDEEDAPRPKKKSFMDDDEDDIPALRAPANTEKTKTDVDKENEEMFRKAAEEDGRFIRKPLVVKSVANTCEAKRAAEQQGGKKGWGFTSWWGGKKEASPSPEPAAAQGNKPIRAKLGESSSFVYDPDQKRWVNKKAGAEQTQAKTATPPPPKSAPRSHAGTPPPPSSTPPMGGSPGGPPPGPPRPPMSAPVANLSKAPSQETLGVPSGLPPMARSVSNQSAGGPPSAPPSRPATSMSNASSIDDLLGAAAPRKAGAKKAKRGGRYVDVMAK